MFIIYSEVYCLLNPERESVSRARREDAPHAPRHLGKASASPRHKLVFHQYKLIINDKKKEKYYVHIYTYITITNHC